LPRACQYEGLRKSAEVYLGGTGIGPTAARLFLNENVSLQKLTVVDHGSSAPMHTSVARVSAPQRRADDREGRDRRHGRLTSAALLSADGTPRCLGESA